MHVRAGPVAAVSAAVLVTGTFASLLSFWTAGNRARALQERQERLAATADERRRVIEAWIDERKADLNVVAAYAPVADALPDARRAPLERAATEDARRRAAAVLSRVAEGYRYLRVWLVDCSGGVLAASAGAPPDLSDHPKARAAVPAACGGAAPWPFARADHRGWHFGLASPVTAGAGRRGALVFEWDPGGVLYPFIRAETIATRTGETMLVAAEGQDVVFLSPLRQDPAPPGRARRPAQPGTAYTEALRGADRSGVFLDYRDARVLAATRPIRGTDWALVVKLDESEALEAHRLSTALAWLGLSTALSGLAAGGLWLRRGERERARRHHAEMMALVEHANDAVLLWRRDGAIFAANGRAEQIWGYRRDDLLRMRLHELRDDRSEQAVARTVESLEREGPNVYEAVHRRRDGAAVQVEVSASALEHQGEQVFLSLVRDVGARKAAEARLANELRLFGMIASDAPLAEILEALARVAEQHAPGVRCAILLAEGGRLELAAAPGLPADMQRAIGTAGGPWGASARARRPVVAADTATDEWAGYRELADRFAVRGFWSLPILGSDETVVGALDLYLGAPRAASAEDLKLLERATRLAAIAVERHRIGEALRRSEAELRAIFDGAVIGMAQVSLGGRLEKWNPALEKFLGYGGAELSALDVARLDHPDDRQRSQELFRALAAGERDAYQVEKRFLDKSGRVVWGRLTASLVRHGNGTPRFGVGMIEDITEQLRLQREMEQAQKMDAIGRLAGGIAHDFNNLLGVILGYGQMLLKGLPPGDEKARRRVEAILTASEKAANLTRQLLAFSRKQTFEPKVLELNRLVEDSAKILHRLVGEDVTLELELAPDLGRIRGDRSQLDQILMNLAVNARDAMPAGGRLSVSTRNAVLDEAFVERHPGSAAGAYVQLSVGDTGCGMSKEVQARVFEPFFTTKEIGKGTGLGLATVYGIVSQSRGYIGLESEPGQGTRFDIYLPRVDDAAAAPEREPARPTRGSETILVVEDEPNLRELLVEQLSGLGYRVIAAARGETALQIAADGEKIHALLTDVLMPEMNGRELARRLLRQRPSLKVLYMSGYTQDVIARYGVLEENLLLIPKPFTGELLAARLREALDSAPEAPARG